MVGFYAEQVILRYYLIELTLSIKIMVSVAGCGSYLTGIIAMILTPNFKSFVPQVLRFSNNTHTQTQIDFIFQILIYLGFLGFIFGKKAIQHLLVESKNIHLFKLLLNKIR